MKNIKSYFFISVGFFIYSLASVIAKINSLTSEPLSINFLLLLALQTLMIAIYSVIWQFNIKNIDLTKAYIFKGTTIMWGMLFAHFIFKEQISLQNIIGVVIIITGIVWGMQRE